MRSQSDTLAESYQRSAQPDRSFRPIADGRWLTALQKFHVWLLICTISAYQSLRPSLTDWGVEMNHESNAVHSLAESPHGAQQPNAFLRLVASIALSLIVGLGLVLLFSNWMPAPHAPPRSVAEVDNPLIAGRFVSDARQLRVHLDAVDQELESLNAQRRRLVAAIKGNSDSADAELTSVLTDVLAYADRRATALRVEKRNIEEKLNELQERTQ